MRRTIYENSTDGISISRIVRDYDYTMPKKHFHDEYEIYYLMEGERFYFIDQDSYTVHKGNLVIVPKNQIHMSGTSSVAYHDRILIEVSEEPFSSFFSSMNELSLPDLFNECRGVIEFDRRSQEYVEACLSKINTEITEKKAGYRTSVMISLSMLLVYALRFRMEHPVTGTNEASSRKQQMVHQVTDYILSNYADDLSLASVSDIFFINKCYLSRIFKESTNLTVNEYINVTRINNASRLLADSDLSISEVAEQCGYKSPTYFEKVFRSYREISPLRYRNDVKKQRHKRVIKTETDHGKN